MERPEINIRLFLIAALGSSQYLHPIIDEMYKERESEYFEHYRKSGFVNDLLLPRYITRNEERMKKVAGIVEWSYNNDNFEGIYKLIKKGYKFCYQYVTNHNEVDLEAFSFTFMKKRGGMDKVTDLQLFSASSVVVYLCTRLNKDLIMDYGYGEIFSKSLTDAIYECYIQELRYSPENRKMYQKQIEDLFQIYEIPKNLKSISIGKLFELFVERATTNKLLSKQFSNYENLRAEVFREGINKYIGSLSTWIKTMGINEMDITDSVEITRSDLEMVFLDYIIASQYEVNHLLEKDRDLYIVSCLIIYALAHSYKEAKQLYLNDSKEERYMDLKHFEEEIKNKEQQIIEKEELLNQELKESKNRILSLEDEVVKLRRLLQQSEEKNQKHDDYTKEIISLRNFVYSLEKEELPEKDIKIQDVTDYLRSKKIAIVGGHPNWQNKLKEYIPHATFMSVEQINRDFSFLDNVDAVFINTSYFNHKFYMKLMSRMSRNNTSLYYLKGSANAQLSLMEIYQFFKVEQFA